MRGGYLGVEWYVWRWWKNDVQEKSQEGIVKDHLVFCLNDSNLPIESFVCPYGEICDQHHFTPG